MQYLYGDPIRKELELVDKQRQQLDQIRKEIQDETSSLYKRLQDVPAEQRQQKYMDMYKELGEKTEKRVREVLLPHQLDRLRQIRVQMQIRNSYSAGQMLSSAELADELKITEEQKKRLGEVQQEVTRDMQVKTQEFYKKLGEESLEKILGVLTPQQRKQLEKLMGQKYEWQPYAPQGGQTQPKK